ncbi:ABC transporter permease [Candidatus Bathyarchaeota archaeon]|nr:MAG: ABC transporter permease [Candidatus Bathyarchaeota archaeon]
MVNISDFISVGLFAAAIRLATPIIYAGLGGMFSERVGIVNIGLEGTMLTSAFTGVVASYYTGNPWIGVLVSVITGGLVSLILAVLTIKYAGDQIVSGTGINIMALGFTSYMTQIIWGNRGASDGVQGISDIAIPIVKDIPVIGPIFGTHSPLVYLMPLVVYSSYYVLFKTPFGLRIRAVGEHPVAAETAGVDVIKIKYTGVIISGMLAGLGGAFLSLSHLNLFTRGMTGGRGFIAMAAMIFGKWMPFGILGSGLLFGFADALQIRLQSLGILPPQIILMIPYLLTIAVLAGVVGKAVAPSDYKPYKKE